MYSLRLHNLDRHCQNSAYRAYHHEIMHLLLRGYCFISITYHTVGVEKNED